MKTCAARPLPFQPDTARALVISTGVAMQVTNLLSSRPNAASGEFWYTGPPNLHARTKPLEPTLSLRGRSRPRQSHPPHPSNRSLAPSTILEARLSIVILPHRPESGMHPAPHESYTSYYPAPSHSAPSLRYFTLDFSFSYSSPLQLKPIIPIEASHYTFVKATLSAHTDCI